MGVMYHDPSIVVHRRDIAAIDTFDTIYWWQVRTVLPLIIEGCCLHYLCLAGHHLNTHYALCTGKMVIHHVSIVIKLTIEDGLDFFKDAY